MGRGRRFHPRTRRTRDGRHVHLLPQQPRAGQRQQRQLDRRGEAAGIGHAPRRTDAVAVQFGKSVDEALRLVAEILRQIDDPQPFGQGVRREELAAPAVRRAEEQHVDRPQIVFRRETQVGLAQQPAVHVAEGVARVAVAVDECDLGRRMIHQQPQQFAGRVAGAADDADPHFFALPLRACTL